MSIFYPDNDHRQDRVSQLGTDSSNYLQQSKDLAKAFEETITQLNVQIAALYRLAGLPPPSENELDILSAANITIAGSTAKTTITVSHVLLDVASFAAAVRYLGPGLVVRLMAIGNISEEAAAATFVTVWGGELTVGFVISGLATFVIGLFVITAIYMAFDAFEGAELRSELRDAISRLCPIRADIYLNYLKSKRLVTGMEAVLAALTNLANSGVPITEAIIKNMIERDVLPTIAAVEGITMDSARADLAALDQGRGSWTNEDSTPIAPVAPTPPGAKPMAAVLLVAPTPPAIPGGCILCPAVPGTWTVPTGPYPVIKKSDYTVWPFSFADHRNAINVAIFDKSGAIVNQWILEGISTVTKIHADPYTNMICFTGDGGQLVHMLWSQVAPARPPEPLHGNIRDMLELLPAQLEFGRVGEEPVARPVMLRNKSDHPLRVSLQVISVLAADSNDPKHGRDPKPAPVTIYLQKHFQIDVPAGTISEVTIAAIYPMQPWWDVYSPSDFWGGVGAEALDLATHKICGGGVTMTFTGQMHGGKTKPGVGFEVPVKQADRPHFVFQS